MFSNKCFISLESISRISSRSAQLRSSNGAILPLAAILLIVIFAFAALAIDMTRMTASQSQQTHTAEYIAITALNSFMDSSGTTFDAKTQDAVEAAERVAGVNFLLGNSYKQANTNDLQVDTDSATAVADHNQYAGRITPGRWWFSDPDCAKPRPDGGSYGNPCPCNGGSWAGQACFEPRDPNDSTPGWTDKVSAFKVDLWSRNSSGTPEGIRSTFAAVIGQEQMPIRSTATAALLPREIFFMVDLSTSVTADTHLTNSPTDGAAFAYRLQGPSGTSPTSDPTYTGTTYVPGVKTSCNIANEPSACPSTDSCAFDWGLGYDPIYEKNYNSDTNRTFYGYRVGVTPPGTVMLKNGSPRPAGLPATVHYKNEYSCYIANYTEDGVAKTEHYLLDSRYDGGEGYRGPEPFTTIMLAMHSAADIMAARLVSGDLIGALGFDDVAPNPKSSNPSEQGIEQRFFPLSQPRSTNFVELQDMTGIPVTAGLIDRTKVVDHMFFPRKRSDNGRGGFTNIPAALRQAIINLSGPGTSASAQKFAVLFSDGMPSCSTRKSPECAYSLDGNVIFQTAMSAFDEIVSLQSELKSKGISFNAVIAGNLFRPSTIATKTRAPGGTGCMSDLESRSTSVSFLTNPFLTNEIVSPSYFAADANNDGIPDNASLPLYSTYYNGLFATSPVNPFPYVNYFWSIVRYSGGVWQPLRQPCDIPGDGVTPARSLIESACGSLTAGDESWGIPNRVLPSGAGDPLSQYMDSGGRIFCDPDDLTPDDQINQMVQTMFSGSTYLLVESRN